MQILKLAKSEAEQTQRVVLGGVACLIRVSWVQYITPLADFTGESGFFSLDISSSLINVKGVALTIGAAILLSSAKASFGGFIVIRPKGVKTNAIFLNDWNLVYFETHEKKAVMKALNVI